MCSSSQATRHCMREYVDIKSEHNIAGIIRITSRYTAFFNSDTARGPGVYTLDLR